MTQKQKHQIQGYDHSLEEQKKIDRDIKEAKAMWLIFALAFVCSGIVILGELGVI